MVFSAIPLAVAANVTRLLMIIFAGEIAGQKAGMYVHDSSVLSMIPYFVAFVGMYFIARLFREDRGTPSPARIKKDSEADIEEKEDEDE